jgi:DNA (cytosine-5)-methyltransferase 1
MADPDDLYPTERGQRAVATSAGAGWDDDGGRGAGDAERQEPLRGAGEAPRRPTFGSLFAGIGGIDLGLERAGWTGRWQVEWDDWCQRVLAKHWPDVPRVGDIRDAHGADHCPVANAERLAADQQSDTSQVGRRSFDSQQAGVGRGGSRGTCPTCLEPVDLIAGGFPCQPFSNAGKRLGKEDDRWLWPEFARVIGELRPRYVLVENVPGLLAGHGGMGAVLGDLASLGYDAEWDSVPAAAVGAPHLRYRVWIVAYARGLGPGREAPLGPSSLAGSRSQEAGAEPDGADPGARDVPDPFGKRGRGGSAWIEDAEDAWQRPTGTWGGWWDVEPDVGRVAHGVPARVDRLRGLGNAVVPQVVEAIGRRLMDGQP